MAWDDLSLVPLDRKEMALVSLQRMPEEKRQKALPAVKQGILKRRGVFGFPVRVTKRWGGEVLGELALGQGIGQVRMDVGCWLGFVECMDS